MPSILKFIITGDKNVTLDDNLYIKDITDDKRSRFLNVASMKANQYLVTKDVYMIACDIPLQMAKLLNTKKISACLLRNNGSVVIIVKTKDYVFVNGKSHNPPKYDMFANNKFDLSIMKQIRNSEVEHG